MPPAIAIHGGAGLIRRDALTPERQRAALASLHRVITEGARALAQGAPALQAVIEAVVALEDDPLFNAGHGAVLAADGGIELDAAVMDGERRAGAVTGVRTVRNPVRLAAAVLEHTPHVLVAGHGAEALAEQLQLERVEPGYFVTPEREAQLQVARASGRFHLDHGGAERDVYGTVGAVAVDAGGHVASATSTGGMVNKRPGRVGDTPIVGAGTFAWDATAAISCTGHGEPLTTLGAAGRVSARMELLGEDLHTAAAQVIAHDLPALGGQGGLIAVDAHGNVALPFNTAGMFRAAQRGEEPPIVAIW